MWYDDLRLELRWGLCFYNCRDATWCRRRRDGSDTRMDGHTLALGAPTVRPVNAQIDGRGMVDRAKPGDWISVHWGWACQILSPRNVESLDRWTRYHLQIANQTL